MIKKTVLLVALIVASLTFGTALTANAGIHIELGDRPYYSHGPRYWEGDYEMIWVPGHWSEYGHHWIHGHYRRVEHRRHHHHDDRVNAEIHLNNYR
jgi:hypothetical protein